MSIEIPAEMRIVADALAARDHLADPAWDTHELVAAQIWRTIKALGHRGGHVLTTGDNSGTLLGLPRGTGPRHGSLTAHLDQHGTPIGPLATLNDWDEREDFDVVIAALAGFDVRLTHDPNIARRRADHITDTTFAVAVTKPGGLIAVIATHDLMDNPNPDGRRQIAVLADLVGAVRFPAGAYRRATGTDEIADLLVLRRREYDAPPRGATWEQTTAVHLDGAEVHVNTYFDTNVDQVLGSIQLDRTGKAPTNLTVVGDRSCLPSELTRALDEVIAVAQRTGLTAGPASLARSHGNAARPTPRARRSPAAQLTDPASPRPDGSRAATGPGRDIP